MNIILWWWLNQLDFAKSTTILSSIILQETFFRYFGKLLHQEYDPKSNTLYKPIFSEGENLEMPGELNTKLLGKLINQEQVAESDDAMVLKGQ